MKDIALVGERSVTVNRENLLVTLLANKEKHQLEYRESVKAYKVLASERLERLKRKALDAVGDNFAAIQQKINRFDPEDDDRLGNRVVLLQSLYFDLEVPEDHTASYDVAISMAKWEVNETVVLTQQQFQCFVLDDWEWQSQFKKLSKSYTEETAALMRK